MFTMDYATIKAQERTIDVANNHSNTRKSNIPVIVEHYVVTLKILFDNPCDKFNNSTHTHLTPVAQEQCQGIYQEEFMKSLDEMCPSKILLGEKSS
ncbi:unnamed protein product [Allacma fusca]|uniref:Uncharacterized protein n=1 Tax=Allacma fusca TaxID=39272 RepID=A0A8J2KQH3_9HEXA|nr:unnamed protein product [Allacma fusca]